jgi:hypothetical protein
MSTRQSVCGCCTQGINLAVPIVLKLIFFLPKDKMGLVVLTAIVNEEFCLQGCNTMYSTKI